MRARLWRPTKPALFAFLMILALLGALVPARWTSWMRGVVQPLAGLQWLVSAGVWAAGSGGPAGVGAAPQDAEPATPRSALEQQNAELRRQIEQQGVLIEDLEQRLSAVTGLRAQLGDRRTSLVIAAVVGHDSSPRRETLLIDKGTTSGLRAGLWVAAGVPREQLDPQATIAENVARQWLIGRIAEVSPYTSRVRLASDPQFAPTGLRVRVARVLPDGRWQRLDQDSLLYGRGAGRMEIRHCTADDFASGHRVVLVPAAAELPESLTIGEVTSSAAVSEAPLFYDLQVRPWGEPRRLTHVFVIVVEL